MTWSVDTSNSAESRMQYISKLLHVSSGAKQVMNSGNIDAIDQRLAAIKLYEKAEIKIKEGKKQEALQLLEQSAELMFIAIKKSAPANLASDKGEREYQARKETVNSLKQAFERISKENNDTKRASKVQQKLASLIEKSESEHKKGNHEKARTEIDKAYHLLKVSIESIRGGQTLTRSLRFKTKEEEYRYELDRNETHHMLTGLLINEKDKSEYTRKKLLKFIDEAKAFRAEAEILANKEEYERAIELLEKSTKQLVRAIRSAGVYIPG